jgi:hypothetical protein
MHGLCRGVLIFCEYQEKKLAKDLVDWKSLLYYYDVYIVEELQAEAETG